MNISALANQAANVAVNAANSESQDVKTAENARGASDVILGGSGVTVTTASPTTEEVFENVAARDPEAQLVQEMITALLTAADLIDALVSELQVLAEALGETPSPEALPKLTTDQLLKACEAFAAGNTEAAEEVVASSWSSTTKTEDTYFSIYALINLMQQVGQEQRNAARELRDCELNAEVASINTQANKQRRAATLNCMVSLITCAAQACLMAYSTADSMKSLKGPQQTSAAQDLAQAETSKQTTQAAMNAAENPQALEENTAAIESKTSDANKTAVEKRLSEDTACKNAKTKLDSIQKAYNGVKDSMKTNAESLTKLEQDKTNLPKDSDPKTVADLETKIAKCNTDLDTAKEAMKSLEGPLQEAKTEYANALDGAMAKMDADYATASEKTAKAEDKHYDEFESGGMRTNRANAKDVKTCQTEQKNLGQQRSLMEAKVAQMKYEAGIPAPTKESLATAEENVGKCKAAQQTSKGYRMASTQMQNHGQTVQFIQQTVGQLGKCLADMIGQLGAADATEEGAHQKEFEAERQETNELFSQAQELINSARQLLQAVLSAESQAVERIISA